MTNNTILVFRNKTTQSRQTLSYFNQSRPSKIRLYCTLTQRHNSEKWRVLSRATNHN